MSFLPDVERGAIVSKREKVVLKKRRAHKKPQGQLPKGQRRKDGKKMWREWHEMTDWILTIPS